MRQGVVIGLPGHRGKTRGMALGFVLLLGAVFLYYVNLDNSQRLQARDTGSDMTVDFSLISPSEINYQTFMTQRRNTVKQDDSHFWDAEVQLQSGLIGPNVHFMWCGERWFEYKHYLSIMSVLRSMKPDKVVFHYEHLPVMDANYYFQWFDDLKHDYPFLFVEEMDEHLVQFCTAERGVKINLILDVLNVEGGLYISENTWLLNMPVLERLVDFEFALDLHSVDGFILQRAGLLQVNASNSENNVTYESLLKHPKYRTKRSTCMSVRHLYNGGGSSALCMMVNEGNYNYFYPMHITDLDDEFGRIARKIAYGTEAIRKPEPSYDVLVPNIAHMIWIGGGPMDFVFYLSVLSLLYVVKVDTVYIHGDWEPKGEYWQRIKRREHRVKFIIRTEPFYIYQGLIGKHYRALKSDIIRVDLMIKYGGIYTDTDAIWTKPLTIEERGYDAVASFDWVDWSFPYPDSVNFGVSYGKKNAPFWQLFRESMRTLHNTSPGFTGVQMPYKLLEKYPHLLRIDRHLQAICYFSLCHPTWVEDYHNISKNHVNMKSIPNWKEDVHALHWTHPNPIELANETMLELGTGMFAELGKYVLAKAGLR